MVFELFPDSENVLRSRVRGICKIGYKYGMLLTHYINVCAGKELRKPLGAPPPPPPSSPAPAGIDGAVSNSTDLNASLSGSLTRLKNEHLTPGVFSTTSEFTPLSHSLPRPVSRHNSKVGHFRTVIAWQWMGWKP